MQYLLCVGIKMKIIIIIINNYWFVPDIFDIVESLQLSLFYLVLVLEGFHYQ